MLQSAKDNPAQTKARALSPGTLFLLAFSGRGNWLRQLFPYASQIAQTAAYAGAMMLLGVVERVQAPFFPWLFCGMGLWFFFQRASENAATTLQEHAPLWQNGFCSPTAAVVSALLDALPTLLLWMGISIAAALFSTGLASTALWAVYYVFCALIHTLAQVFLTAAFAPFSPDTLQGLKLMLFITFWGTPILWPADILSGFLFMLCRLNPLYYLVDGLRGCLLHGTLPLWNDTLWFFMVTAVMGIIGIFSFIRLAPHYEEVMNAEQQQ